MPDDGTAHYKEITDYKGNRTILKQQEECLCLINKYKEVTWWCCLAFDRNRP